MSTTSWAMVEGNDLTQHWGEVAVSPDGAILALSQNGEMTLFDAATMTKQNNFCLVMQPDRLLLHWGNPTTLFAIHDAYGDLFEITVNPARERRQWSLRRQSPITAIAVSPQSVFVAFGYADGTIEVYRMEDKKEMQGVNVSNHPIKFIRFIDDNSFVGANDHGSVKHFTVR